MATFIRNIEGEDSIEVCVELDGIRLCGFVSSMHLVSCKEVQITRAIVKMAEQALLQNATDECSS